MQDCTFPHLCPQCRLQSAGARETDVPGSGGHFSGTVVGGLWPALLAESLPLVRHTAMAQTQLLPKQNPFSTAITKDLTTNLE